MAVDVGIIHPTCIALSYYDYLLLIAIMSCSYKGLPFHSVLFSVISFYPHTKWQIFIEGVVLFSGEPPGSCCVPGAVVS